MIVGIDPGASGAIVVLQSDGGYVSHLNMPTLKVGDKNRVNGAAVAAFLVDALGDTPRHTVMVMLEQVGAMPGQGVNSMFSFGHAAGIVEGVVAGMGLPVTLVKPQAWKKVVGLLGTDKDAARSRAIQLYPSLRVLDLKEKGQAVADALLIARYGLSLVGSGSVI